MGKKLAYRDYLLTIPANGEETLSVTGRYVRCIESDLDSFQIGIDEEATAYFEQGMQISLAAGETPFDSIRIKNTDGSNSLTVRMGIGFGEVLDNRYNISGTVDATILNGSLRTYTLAKNSPASNVSIATGATPTLIVSQNFTRQRALLFNNESVGGTTLYVGPNSSITTSNAFPIPPQQALVLNSDEPIYGVHGGASAVDLRLLEEYN